MSKEKSKDISQKSPLRKQQVYNQLKEWVEQMQTKGEWHTVQRHLTRALWAAEDLLRRSK